MSFELNRTIVGDCRETMRRLIGEGARAQCCVTSPPYWGLRDYGVAGQIGLERTVQEYIDTMVEVFRLVRELLADDGTLWLNLGDCYAGSWGAQSREHAGKHSPNVSALSANQVKAAQIRANGTGSLSRTPNLKPKDLVLLPARVALALQADGWWLRQDIIWHKPNPMPESMQDRCTKAHEYIFLLSKSERYYFDAEAISEPSSVETHPRGPGNRRHKLTEAEGNGESRHRTAAGLVAYSRKLAVAGSGIKNNGSFDGAMSIMPERRNKRSVWTVASEPYAEAHFATFPTALIEPCILAGSRVGDIVFDPLIGSGTTGQVAQNLGRRWIGCELNPEYVKLERKRTAQQAMQI